MFDVVLGNPPYNGEKKGPGKPLKAFAGSGRRNLYSKFAFKFAELTDILLFVTPPGIFKTFNENRCLFFDFLDENSMSIHLINLNAGDYFKVGTPVCYWLVSKKDYDKIIITQKDKTIDVDKQIDYIPVICDNLSLSIIDKMTNNSGQNLQIKDINPSTFKGGISFGCLLGGSNKIKVYTDDTLLYKSLCLNVETEDITNLKMFFESKTMKNWFIIHRYNAFLYKKVLNRIRIPHDMSIINTEQDIYTFYNFTQEEIDYIEENAK